MAKPRGRPPKTTIFTQHAELIKNAVQGTWTMPQFAALLSLARLSNVKEAARQATKQGREGKDIAPETVKAWMAIPLFQEDMIRVRDSLKTDIANEYVSQIYSDALIPLEKIEPKMGMAWVKNRELLAGILGLSKKGIARGVASESVPPRKMLAGTSDEDLLAVAEGEKSVQDIIEARVIIEESGDTREENGSEETA